MQTLTWLAQDFSAARSYGTEVVQATLDCVFGSILWRLHGLQEANAPSTEDLDSLQAAASTFSQQLSRLHRDCTSAELKDAAFAMHADLLLLFGEGKAGSGLDRGTGAAACAIRCARRGLCSSSLLRSMRSQVPSESGGTMSSMPNE